MKELNILEARMKELGITPEKDADSPFDKGRTCWITDPLHRRTLRHLFDEEILFPSISITLPLVFSLVPQPFG